MIHSMVRKGLMRLVAFSCATIALGALAVQADSTYTTTYVKIPCTYYDYHRDRSNPEFENRYSSNHNTPAPGLTMDTLDKDRKPVKNQARGNCNLINNLYKWFRPWTDPIAQSMQTYVEAETLYTYSFGPSITPILGTGGDTAGWDTAFVEDTARRIFPDSLRGPGPSDTSFINVVLHDSLLFVPFAVDSNFQPLVKGNDTTTDTIIFKNYQDIYNGMEFYVLKNRGFDSATTKGNNDDFCMEAHDSILYHGGIGEFVSTNSDDDSWVFINDTLRCDLGGLRSGGFTLAWLDSLHLTRGKKYPIDMFYCDRASAGIVLQIKNNLDFVTKSTGTMNIVGVSQKPAPAAQRTDLMAFALGNGQTLMVPKATKSVTLKIYNALGQQVWSRTLADANRMKVSLPKLMSGVFFAKVTCRDVASQQIGSVFARLVPSK